MKIIINRYLANFSSSVPKKVLLFKHLPAYVAVNGRRIVIPIYVHDWVYYRGSEEMKCGLRNGLIKFA